MVKKWFVGIVVSVVMAAPSATAWGSLVSSFKSPCNYPVGLGYLDGELYIAGVHAVYRTTTAGSLLGSFDFSPLWTLGLTAGKINSTDYCWVIAGPLMGPDYIYRLIATTGSVCGSYLGPGLNPRGLAFRDNNSLYCTDKYPTLLHLLDPMSGSVRDSFSLDFRPMDAAYDPAGYLWIPQFGFPTVWKCTTTGSSVASFTTAAYGAPQGCTFDGVYVWVGVVGGVHPNLHHLVMQFEVGSEPAVAPASLGKVKALYR